MDSGIADLITSAAQRYGQDPAAASAIAEIESSGDPGAHNPSGAAGLFQFMPSTARQYGLSDPYDPAANADAAMRLMRDNGSYLAGKLGRDPTPGELYLAHQQGAGGAVNLLSNPDVPAASVVGRSAVVQNGGTPDMTAGQFASLWTNKVASRLGGASASDASSSTAGAPVRRVSMATGGASGSAAPFSFGPPADASSSSSSGSSTENPVAALLAQQDRETAQAKMMGDGSASQDAGARHVGGGAASRAPFSMQTYAGLLSRRRIA